MTSPPRRCRCADLRMPSMSRTAPARGCRGDRLPPGVRVGGGTPFFIGTADIPIDPPPGWQPESLRAKVAAGAQFIQTQFCMDAAIVRRYAAGLAEAGLSGRVFL